MAKNLKTNTEWALKIMPRTSDQIMVNEIFENEIKIMEIFDHPNILKCYNSNEKASIVDSKQINIPVYAIELEYAENGDFFDIIEATGKFSEKDARFYFHQLISAIEYIHGMGYWHRDIKAENLLLDSEFNLKLADFGFWTNSDLCQDRVGTLAYMSPEVLGRKKSYDGKKMDLFSSAVCLFTLVVGHPPFKKASTKDRCYKRIWLNQHEKFWLIHEKTFSNKQSLSSSFKDLVTKMLSFSWDDRLSLEDIKEHEWFKGTVTSPEDLSYIMKLRQKGVQASKILTFESSQNSIFNGIEILNDDDVNLINKKRVCKGLQIK